MQLVSIDDHAHTANNRPMEYGNVGRRVKLRRVELSMTQQQLADAARVGLGTVLALENAPKWIKQRKPVRQTTTAKLERIAKALGWSFDELTADRDTTQSVDPLRAGLEEDDLLIARAYHNARTALKLRTEALLLRNGENKRLTALVGRITRLSEKELRTVEEVIALVEDGHSVVIKKTT